MALPTGQGQQRYPYKFNISRNKDVSRLYESLISQATAQYGLDVYYLPLRNRFDLSARDSVLREVANKDYSKVFYFRSLMLDVQQLKGGDNIYTKFGLMIEDSVTLFITVKDFKERTQKTVTESTSPNELWSLTDIDRPQIQDIIFVPMYDSFYELNYVERYEQVAVGYTSGYNMYCKKLALSVTDSIFVDRNATGYDPETGKPAEFELVLDQINNDKMLKRDEKKNIILDPTETGFSPSSTSVLNDDYRAAAEVITDKADDSKTKTNNQGDIFGNW